MHELLRLFDQYGPLLVFLNVLFARFGLPLPAAPSLLVAGMLAAQGQLVAWQVLALAVLGASIANFSWFLAGRRYGLAILGQLCRISLSPDACVRRTENVFVRWGLAALVVARFVPGLSAVSAPLAGAMGFGVGRFLLFDAIGTTLWAACAIGAGMLLNRQVEALLLMLAGIGLPAVLLLAGLLVLYMAWRWIERRRLLAFALRHRIEVDELRALLAGEVPPVIVDVRSRAMRGQDTARIPGALEAEIEEVCALLEGVPHEREIVLYCNCPNEASAARAARLLQAAGFQKVRALRGGLRAWETL